MHSKRPVEGQSAAIVNGHQECQGSVRKVSGPGAAPRARDAIKISLGAAILLCRMTPAWIYWVITDYNMAWGELSVHAPPHRAREESYCAGRLTIGRVHERLAPATSPNGSASEDNRQLKDLFDEHGGASG